jgi:hypothetical protein
MPAEEPQGIVKA